MVSSSFCARALAFAGIFLWQLASFADSTTSTEPTPSSQCTQAISDYHSANGALGTVCNAWGEGQPLYEWFKGDTDATPSNCPTTLSGCSAWERNVAERGCLDKLAGNSSPSAKDCEEHLRPASPNAKCTFVTSMDSAELARVDRDNTDLIRSLIADRNKAQSEAGTFVSDLTKSLQDMQKQESEVRAEIVALKAELEALGPQTQQELQKAYNAYIKALEEADLSFEEAVRRFNTAKLQKREAKMKQKAMCQETAKELFLAEKERREALNNARRNSTNLNNLTGNAQRFDANLKKYLDQCLQSEIYITSMKQIENMYQMAETEYKNVENRLKRMRQHLEDNYKKNEAMLQASAQLQMKSLMEQIQALEQKIQQLRANMLAQQALAQTERQQQQAGIQEIEDQITGARNSAAATACVAACSAHLRPPGLGVDAFDDFTKMLEAYNDKERHCDRIKSVCVSDHWRGLVTAPSGCVPEKVELGEDGMRTDTAQ